LIIVLRSFGFQKNYEVSRINPLTAKDVFYVSPACLLVEAVVPRAS